MGTAGDVNGDGYSDVIVGAPYYDGGENNEGRIFVYYGNEGDGLHRVARQARADGSAPIALLGLSDSNDRFLLKVVGRTPAGRGNVRVQYEVKPFGTPFNGSELVTGEERNTGVPGEDGSVYGFCELVTGLTSNALYHWRLRTLTDSPFFPRSPWFSLPYNCMTEADVRVGLKKLYQDHRTISKYDRMNQADLPVGALIGMASEGPVSSTFFLGCGTPNPFKTWTQLKYMLPERGHVRLAVLDVTGREVAVLKNGQEAAGTHVVEWDGRAAHGTRLAPGVYFVQLSFGDHREAQKVMLTQ